MSLGSGGHDREETRESTWRRRGFALAAALVCHGTFLLGVSAMFLGMRDGLVSGRMRLDGAAGWTANVLLALQFPLAHSFLLTPRGRGWLARAVGRHGRTLAPTTYSFVAALQILATFTLWTPSNTVWWQPSGSAGLAMHVLYGCAWLFLGKALWDGGLGLQAGWIGWTALWRGIGARFPPLPERGLFSVCRQPIYLGFALTLWTGPVWTPDRLLLATLWSLYCLLGPLHKERRFLHQHGEAFAAYRRRVPYMLPLRRGAA
jgi:protein-S-isoprenylcysteine O-methyltransferase Ste14